MTLRMSLSRLSKLSATFNSAGMKLSLRQRKSALSVVVVAAEVPRPLVAARRPGRLFWQLGRQFFFQVHDRLAAPRRAPPPWRGARNLRWLRGRDGLPGL